MNPEAIADLLLSSSGPRDAARRMLDWLLDYTRARSVSVWVDEADALSMTLGTAVDGETIAAVEALWSREREQLRGGMAVTLEKRALVPCAKAGTYVCVEGTTLRKAEIDTVRTVAAVAARALGTAGPAAASESIDTLKRSELVATLSLHEWNISRVARAKGVTRKTIYDWMTKLNIPRERVAKS
jgi:transcriptional regulator of acetoin/glycerol metabolism